jgi:DNA-directed RNA polymerase specialized sigma24 family protein
MIAPLNDGAGAVVSCAGDASRAVDSAWRVLRPTLRPMVWGLSSDVDEQDDLMQEALIELWQVDPTRFDLEQSADREYLRRMLVNRMLDVSRVANRRGLVWGPEHDGVNAVQGGTRVLQYQVSGPTGEPQE